MVIQDLVTGECYNNLADAYTKLGEYREAIDYYSKSLQLIKVIYGNSQPAATAYINLGSAYFSLGEHQRAIECFYQSLETN